MEYADEKRRLLETAIETGRFPGEKDKIQSGAPLEMVERWYKRFYGPVETVRLLETPRLVNHFTLGADPEFIFLDKNLQYVYGENCGMDTLQAFGCDMSGRQVEVRAHPSKFAFDVVASIGEALRWMGAVHPNTLAVNWIAAANFGKDGCGGHLHFGRKRPTLVAEVGNLNHATSLLLGAGVLSQDSFDARVRGTVFGKWGDIRKNFHGYEYRTLPTELFDPLSTYLALVLGKLVVHHGKPIRPVKGRERQQIINLLNYYKAMDDDAAIALKALEVREFLIPAPHERDFKFEWGIGDPFHGAIERPSLGANYFPPTIPPSQRLREDLFGYLVQRKTLPLREPAQTWEPFKLQKGVYRVRVQPHILTGVVDVAMGLVSYGVRVTIMNGERLTFAGQTILNRGAILGRLSNLISSQGVAFNSEKSGELIIGIPEAMRKNRDSCKQLKEIISDPTLFPICSIENLKNTDWSIWKQEKVDLPSIGMGLGTYKGQKEVKQKKGVIV